MLVLGESRFATETITVRWVVFHDFVLCYLPSFACWLLANIRPLARVDSAMAGQTR
jgi:hypothetical protein